MIWKQDSNLQNRLEEVIESLNLVHINTKNVFVFRSFGSKSRAIARIWSLPRIWQQALNKPAGYCVEIISEKFDRLDEVRQTKVLIHELLHIPKTFSGSLLSHRTGSFRISESIVNKLYQQYVDNTRR